MCWMPSVGRGGCGSRAHAARPQAEAASGGIATAPKVNGGGPNTKHMAPPRPHRASGRGCLHSGPVRGADPLAHFVRLRKLLCWSRFVSHADGASRIV